MYGFIDYQFILLLLFGIRQFILFSCTSSLDAKCEYFVLNCYWTSLNNLPGLIKEMARFVYFQVSLFFILGWDKTFKYRQVTVCDILQTIVFLVGHLCKTDRQVHNFFYFIQFSLFCLYSINTLLANNTLKSLNSY